MVRKPPPAQGRNRRLTASEEKRLLNACDAHSNPMLGWIVRLAMLTGMRQGEIESLTRDQVNLKQRTIELTETKNGSARTVPLPKDAAAVLRAAMDNPVRPIDTALIFFGEPGKDDERRPYVFKPAWLKALRSAKIKGLRFHDLRHEAVSRLIESGLNPVECRGSSFDRQASTASYLGAPLRRLAPRRASQRAAMRQSGLPFLPCGTLLAS